MIILIKVWYNDKKERFEKPERFEIEATPILRKWLKEECKITYFLSNNGITAIKNHNEDKLFIPLKFAKKVIFFPHR